NRSRETINRELDRAFGITTADANAPESQPVPEKKGINPLRTSWAESNGDLIYRRHLTVWGRHVLASVIVILASFGLAL
ncbi:MAG: hypothetical protein KC519_22310, partial [Anaerolineae bacterium]|nr:hypothetical protein [Anaerolineae bacterium]